MSVLGKLRDSYRARIVPRLLRRRLKPVPRPDLEDLGDDNASWVVPTSRLSSSSICYCVGVGEDVSFDLALIEQFGCKVWAFDPTPRAIRFAEGHAAREERFHFLPVGLWSEDTTLRFYAPSNPAWVSHSAVNLQNTSEYFEAPCRSVASLMKELGHGRIDLLKMDVEGAEYEVLDGMMRDAVAPRILCVEFDQPMPTRRTIDMVSRLTDHGYLLTHIQGWNYTFVLDR